MAITDNPLLEYESGQHFYPWQMMTDTGNHQRYEADFAPWSGRSGYGVQIRPYGLATGGDILPNSSPDSVSVAALSAYMPGCSAANGDGVVMVAAGDVSLTRASIDTHIINSLIVQPDGSLQAIQGPEGTSFSEQRNTSGGPPLIPTDAIEIGQIRLADIASATIDSTEIFTVAGIHRERFDAPVWKENPTTGEIEFTTPLPAIHTGQTTKQIAITGYTPIFAEVPRCSDFKPAEETNSVSSTEIYNGTLGSVSKSLGQASFTHYGNDGLTDPLVQLKGEKLWFRFFQDKNRTPYTLTQGILGIARTFPAGKHVQINCTVSAEQASEDFSG